MVGLLDAAASSLSSDLFPIQLAFCFCLFGFFGTIISTSFFLKWQKRKCIIQNNSTNLKPTDEAQTQQQAHQFQQPKPNSHTQIFSYQSYQSYQQISANNHANISNNYHTPLKPMSLKPMSLKPMCFKPLSPLSPISPTSSVRSRAYSHREPSTPPSTPVVPSRTPRTPVALSHLSYPLLPHYQILQNNNNHSYSYLNGHNNVYNNTQIILDWDDTLFPTSYTLLNMKTGKTNSNYIDSNDWDRLYDLTDSVYALLLIYIQLFGANNICIVTNAKLTWWNDSCLMYKKLYSKIHYLLVNIYNIRIISAFDMYSRQKSCAFMDVLRNKYSINQVICIGDSSDEYDAIHCVVNKLRITNRDINYYRFKLLDSPSVNAMIKQIDSIKKLDYSIISQLRRNQSYQFK